MRKLSLLIADIDTTFAGRVEKILAQDGMPAELRSVPDLGNLRAALDEGLFDAILSDHRLADGDGLQALSLVRGRCSRTPFLILTEPCGEAFAVEALRSGAADLILKTDLASLPGRLRRILESYEEAPELREAQELLRMERANLLALIENSPDAVWSMDPDFNVLAFNSAASLLQLKLGGAPMVPGCDFLRCLPTAMGARWKAAMARVMVCERFGEEFDFAWKGGGSRYRVSFGPIVRDGRAAGMAVVARETADANAAEADPGAGERRFRMLSEASIEAIAVIRQGKIEAANRAMAEMFGYSETEIVGRGMAEFIAPESEALVRSRMTEAGEARYEAVGLRRDGTLFPIEIRGRPSREGGVRIKGILDLSRQKRTEEELDSFFRLSLDMFCILGFDGRIRRANPAWERVLGYPAEDLVGLYSMDLIHPEDRDATLIQAARLAHGQEMASFGNRYRHKDGSWRWLLWSAAARPAEGEIYAVARDVTESKRAEEENRKARDLAEEASRAKGRFLANMSHEIRTPMNGVVSMAGLLAEMPMDPKQRGYVKIIQTSARSLLRVINDILDFSKLEQGKLDLENRPFDLRELVGDVADLFMPAACEKGIRLDWSFAPGTPHQVQADPGRLRQILVNLVGNAIKFTEQGRVEIRARAGKASGREMELRFEIEDSGPGIGNVAGRRLFKPFSQQDASDTRKHGGTGLGLAISKQLAELMEGTIGYESGPGKGTCFWFTIKAIRPDLGGPARERESRFLDAPGDAASESGAPPLRILVAEDNPINQMVAVCLLERIGYRADVVANGREALDACKAKEYDVIFMDCQMPELDGYAATARIRWLGKKGGRRPYIVAMTADALPGSRERCLAAGMDGHLTKPVLLEDLKAALARRPAPDGASARDPLGQGAGGGEVLDFRIVERLRAASGADPDGQFGELVEGFLSQAREKLPDLASLCAQGRHEELAKAAHGMKGLSLNFGCLAMARKCDAIQRAAGMGDAPGLAALIDALTKELPRAEGMLKAMIAPAGTAAVAKEGKDG